MHKTYDQSKHDLEDLNTDVLLLFLTEQPKAHVLKVNGRGYDHKPQDVEVAPEEGENNEA